MKTYVDILVEVPCFKCLLWNPIMESHLHCNPNECQTLTKWLFKQAENNQTEDNLIIQPLPTGSLRRSGRKNSKWHGIDCEKSILTITLKWKIGTFNFSNLLFLLGDEIASPSNPADTSTQTDPTEESKPQACPFLWWRVYPNVGHGGRGPWIPRKRELSQEERIAPQWG